MGEGLVYRPDPETRKTDLGGERWTRGTWPNLLVFLIVLVVLVLTSSRFN
jgi:hypothetical protein